MKLGFGEYYAALEVGKVRHTKSLKDKRTPDWKGGELQGHMIGACGECAYCKWRGIYWGMGVDEFNVADADRIVQIRTTQAHRPYYKVKKDDPDKYLVVFICSDDLDHGLVGWMEVSRAKQVGKHEDWGNRGAPAYRVTEEQMEPMATYPLPRTYVMQSGIEIARCVTHGDYPAVINCPGCYPAQEGGGL